ncbi:MAG TPA: hypothetical protein VMU99_03185 [Acidimicrobiales bacterium]|nr:hypothetical protein [Acidimicrobiales bacterium]
MALTANDSTYSSNGVPESDNSVERIITVKEFEQFEIETELLFRDGLVDIEPNRTKYVTLSAKNGRLMMQANGWIGTIPLNESITLQVVPRTPLRNLTKILLIAGYIPERLSNSLRRYLPEDDLSHDLLELYAKSICDFVDRIAQDGLIRDYRQHEEATSFPRGRIMMNRTVTTLQARGTTHRVAASWFERTVDIDCNRCIKHALWFLAKTRNRIPNVEAHLSRRLNRAYQLFEKVELDTSLNFLSDPWVTGKLTLPATRAYYRDALDLSVAIAHQEGISHEKSGESIPLSSLVIQMSDVFESFIYRTLATDAEHRNLPVSVLGNPNDELLSAGMYIEAEPDVVVRPVPLGSKSPVVVEVKYKPAKDRPDRDDLEQTIVYGLSYECKDVVIVQPKGRGGFVGHRWIGAIGDIEIHQYIIDLSANDLRQEQTRLTDFVMSLVDAARISVA